MNLMGIDMGTTSVKTAVFNEKLEELKKLTAELQKHGIKVFASFFDMDAEPELEGVKKFTELHPELIAGCTNPDEHETGIFMIKRFADGTYYEDFFLQKAIEVLQDYGFDGIHLPDGICRPRLPLQNAEYSADMLPKTLDLVNRTYHFNLNCEIFGKF